ncbi:hypothetical protein A1O3_01943 [Capronia epimyces CBS 606.96]|uniref:Uncharacterized protein n=1 Tax=Capronia epimyces CBS 606.96 TaxID=1182542 RepID=W9Z314_9EURO|nr:uncharacterized protein A1O3_01943 [Capronia epimyces CBS 606.96]EXJ88879.1 hypothetical protein A1O3_01943 [Capronia epimyces CBS 606.96]
MPRPPLRRRQLSRAGPPPRIGKKVPSSTPARLELEKKLAHKPTGQRPNDSDDSDRLVVKGNGRRGRNVPRQEIYASGAVGKGDKPGNHPSRAQRRRNMTRVTNEILAQTQQDARTSNPSSTEQPPQRSPVASGDTNRATSTQSPKPVPPRVYSSATKPPASILRSALPTPTRENSILGTLKPRRRQPSILQALEHDSSTFDLEDEEQFLPDAESTPMNPARSRTISSTPATNSSHVSSSKKRKLSSVNIFQPSVVDVLPKPTASPVARSRDTTGTPEPSLPPAAVSALRKSRRNSLDKAGNEDIMALPESSSSLSLSPVKTKTRAMTRKSRKKATKPAPIMATEELQALMMPRKRRRTARTRTRLLGEFDIAPDSDTDDSEHIDLPNGGDESSFLPATKGRKLRRKVPVVKSLNTQDNARGGTRSGNVDKQGHSAVAGKSSKSNTSTRHLIATKAPVLAPFSPTSTRWNHSTKSPLQLSVVDSSNLNSNRAIKHGQRKQGGKSKHLGGSLRGEQGPSVGGADKENLDPGDGLLGKTVIEDVQAGSMSAEVAGTIKDKIDGDKSKSTATMKGKWADIDAWDLDFEDVEVMTGSSSPSPMRR